MTAQERIAELEAENAALRAQVGELAARFPLYPWKRDSARAHSTGIR